MFSLVQHVFSVTPGQERQEITCFFYCHFTWSCWAFISITWEEMLDVHGKIALARQTFPFPFFIEIFLIADGKFGNYEMLLSLTGNVVLFGSGSDVLKIS